jgi:hypothetical protein
VLDKARAVRWKGLRQDSGDPYVYVPRAKEIYDSMGIDHSEKIIIFSDSVDVDKALKLKKQCDELGFKGRFRYKFSTKIANTKGYDSYHSVLWNRHILDERFQVCLKRWQREESSPQYGYQTEQDRRRTVRENQRRADKGMSCFQRQHPQLSILVTEHRLSICRREGEGHLQASCAEHSLRIGSN